MKELKITYELSIYEDGVLVMQQFYDDFNEALERYAVERGFGYYTELFEYISDDKENILKTKKFKECWE
ncbi:hypothetical protein [Lactococcus garvieae]|uniref:Uncharacterized protein n=1 Tax=Lactococcus garvieae TaxID=1363 RepID=A0A1I4I5J2_9LACT|nr:hypothetical protein [Lactococcus garvieae]SFL49544.1 hypothetical protein SAMN05216438_11322 [Lactococcus garvieae]